MESIPLEQNVLEWNVTQVDSHTRASSPSDRQRARDRDWVQSLRAGDRTVFPEIYCEFFPRVLAFVRRRLSDSAEAEDLTQEIFIQLLRSIGCFEGRSSLLSWTFGIAHNVCCRHIRNISRRRVKLELALSVDAVETRIEGELDAAESFDRCIALLETRVRHEDREIFRLRFADDLTLEAIAVRTGRSKDSVRNSLKRSRSILSVGVIGLDAVFERSHPA